MDDPVGGARLPDPGRQPERTALAWTRTSAAVLANALAVLRGGLADGSLPLMLLGALCLAAASGVWLCGRHRSRAVLLHTRRSAGFPPWIVAAAAMLSSIGGLVEVVVRVTT
ncbi:DUF202 domain-containing protein [Cupriavidus pauculus]|uniref:DUF202 domain-containing protein n=1 Tax=Cupriavidus pauculus TaxID=82633 RepID=UPI00168B65AC